MGAVLFGLTVGLAATDRENLNPSDVLVLYKPKTTREKENRINKGEWTCFTVEKVAQKYKMPYEVLGWGLGMT